MLIFKFPVRHILSLQSPLKLFVNNCPFKRSNETVFKRSQEMSVAAVIKPFQFADHIII